MRIYVAGATGAVGKRLVPLLVARGHRVVASTRTSAKTDELRAWGAEPVIVDGLDRDAVMRAVVAARPDAVVHQMTALARLRNLKAFDAEFALTNRLRTEGTEYLLAGAAAAGASRFIAQSYTGWPNAHDGARVQSEDDALESNPPRAMRPTLDAILQLEALVAGASGMTGVVLRYGSFYGPGTSLGPGGDLVQMVQQRKFPVVGGGAGVWSFVHVDDLAAATRLAIEGGPSGLYNIVDDDPAEVSTWLPALAEAVGAKPPHRIPAWLGRLAIGEVGVLMMTRIKGSSNARAKRLLNWRLMYPSWRDGFRELFAARSAA